MNTILAVTSDKPALRTRLFATPLVRIVLGIVLTCAAIPLTMTVVSHLVDKPYRAAWPQLLAAVLVWMGYNLYVRRIERRQPSELSTHGMARELGAGLLLGTGLVAATFAILALAGIYCVAGSNPLRFALLTPLAELVLVGMTEEMVFRGVIFGVLQRALGNKAAIGISTLLFSLAHLPNDGISILAVLAIAAYGVLQAALYMRTRRLWICIGTHVAWNYCVSQVFSSTVSGHSASAGLLRSTLVGDTMLTGGVFGVEGSLVTVLVISGAAAFWLRHRIAADHALQSAPQPQL